MTKRILTLDEVTEIGRRNRASWDAQRQARQSGQVLDTRNKSGPESRSTKVRPKVPKLKAPSETAECLAFIGWTQLVFYKGRPLRDRVVKIPNERGKRGIATAILTSIGMAPGFPDYDVLAPAGRWHGLYLEAKKRDGGNVATDQNGWRDLLTEFGYRAEICAGALELIEATKQYFIDAGCVADGSWVDNTRMQA